LRNELALLELALQCFDLVGATQCPKLSVDERDPFGGLPPASHVVIRHHASESVGGDRPGDDRCGARRY
jgi:hypothetical protein